MFVNIISTAEDVCLRSAGPMFLLDFVIALLNYLPPSLSGKQLNFRLQMKQNWPTETRNKISLHKNFPVVTQHGYICIPLLGYTAQRLNLALIQFISDFDPRSAWVFLFKTAYTVNKASNKVYWTKFKLLVKTNLIICAFVHFHYQISREKFDPEPGLELGPPDL